jgi:hypothetical protein
MMTSKSRTATRIAQLLLTVAIAVVACSPGPTNSDGDMPLSGGATNRRDPDGVEGGASGSNEAASAGADAASAGANAASAGTDDAVTGEGGMPDLALSDDLYLELPSVPVVDGAATVDRKGGHLDFPEGFSLDIPAGALTKPIEIRGHTTNVPAAMAGLGSPAQPVIELLPSGTVFARPARLRTSAPSAGLDAVFMVAAEPDDPVLEDVRISAGEPNALDATLWHFTMFGLFVRNDLSEEAVEDVARTSGCATAPVKGLSLQIAAVFRELVGDELVPLAGVGTSDPLGAPLMQPLVAQAFIAALSDPNAVDRWRIQITSGWRSVAQQYVLANCKNGNAVARPGTSNHADGTAVDLVGAWSSAAACTAAACVLDKQTKVYDCGSDLLARAHSVWGHILEKPTYGFQWYGTGETGTKACGDPPHFDAGQAGLKDLKADSVRAFQVLWNRNHPCQAVTESGTFDFDTDAVLAVSPAGGFPATTAIELPTKGLGPPQLEDCADAKLCCPANRLHSRPYCALECDCDVDTCPNGCCDADGQCLAGHVGSACGTGGDSCVACTGTASCGGGGVAQKCGTCNASNCPNGCCSAAGCQVGTATAACGAGGQTCVACGGSDTCGGGGSSKKCGSCDASSCPTGCCTAAGCQAGTASSACGSGGNACGVCKLPETCGGTGVPKSCGNAGCSATVDNSCGYDQFMGCCPVGKWCVAKAPSTGAFFGCCQAFGQSDTSWGCGPGYVRLNVLANKGTRMICVTGLDPNAGAVCGAPECLSKNADGSSNCAPLSGP